MRAAENDTIFIMEGGTTAIVAMSYQSYLRLVADASPFLAKIGMSGLSRVDLDTSLPKESFRIADAPDQGDWRG